MENIFKLMYRICQSGVYSAQICKRK